jgi:hypothetical protein
MKRFTDYINEAKNEDDCPESIPDICEILSHKTPIAFRQLLKMTGKAEGVIYGYDFGTLNDSCYNKHKKVYERNYECVDAITSWFESEKVGKSEFMPLILKMGECPKKGPWACWEGTGYRGLVKSKRWVETVNFTGEVATKPNRDGKPSPWLVAEGMYKSMYPAQSWTSNWKVATKFASDNAGAWRDKTRVIVEMPLTKKNTLFGPQITNEMSNYREDEIIRTDNKPTKCRMYIDTYDLHKQLNWAITYPIKMVKDSEKEEYYIKEWGKRLAGAVGNKNAKKLMSSPDYLQLVKKRRKTDYL